MVDGGVTESDSIKEAGGNNLMHACVMYRLKIICCMPPCCAVKIRPNQQKQGGKSLQVINLNEPLIKYSLIKQTNKVCFIVGHVQVCECCL